MMYYYVPILLINLNAHKLKLFKFQVYELYNLESE